MNFQDIIPWIIIVLICIGAIITICYIQVKESECEKILNNKKAYWDTNKNVEPGYTYCCVHTYVNHLRVDNCEVVKK